MEKLQGANDLDAAEALVQEAGFDVTKDDWLRYQEKESLELSDEELESVAGGKQSGTPLTATIPHQLNAGNWSGGKYIGPTAPRW